MATPSLAKIQLIYVYDPMCSWCWGYRPTWLALQDALDKKRPELEISYRLGGLAPDSDQPMAIDMQQFLQQTWQKIASQLQTQFNFDFWKTCQPKRSTYPACRACLIARDAGREREMLFAIQQAYYLQAKNPSDTQTLITIAKTIGLNEQDFARRLSDTSTRAQLIKEIDQAHTLPIQGFPSLVLKVADSYYPIAIDYQCWENTLALITRQLQS